MPGAKAREPAAPPTRAAGDMQPTEALFDAINRGDIAAARDSLNRGADLNGVNVLGMTPMELSVDLGRNDISFLLLSMRGEDSGRGSRSVGRDSAAGPGSVGPTAAVRTSKAVKPFVPAKAAPVATKPLATPKLFASDGGTPLPDAGFLGFDSRSANN
jgi:ankyrin repeat protein